MLVAETKRLIIETISVSGSSTIAYSSGSSTIIGREGHSPAASNGRRPLAVWKHWLVADGSDLQSNYSPAAYVTSVC